MRHAKPGRLETAPTSLSFGRHCFQLCLCGASGNRTYRAWGKYSITELFSETSCKQIALNFDVMRAYIYAPQERIAWQIIVP